MGIQRRDTKEESSSETSVMLDIIKWTRQSVIVTNQTNMNPISKAVIRGNVNEINHILSEDRNLSKTPDIHGLTPLHLAAYEGNTNVVEILLREGFQPDALNKTGDTPLHLAALNGKERVTEVLMTKNVTKLSTASRVSLLRYARYNEKKPQLVLLKNPDYLSPEGNTPLHFAAFAGHLGVVNILLNKNVNPNQITGTGHSPLHYASLKGFCDIVSALIKAGADPNAKDDHSRTPVHFAAINGHASVVDLLAKEKADLWIQADTGRTALHQAAFYGRLVTVQKLVEIQSDLIDITDNMELTAEDAGHIQGYHKVACWLMEKSPRLTEKNIKTRKLRICKDLIARCPEIYFMNGKRMAKRARHLASAIDIGFCDLHYQDKEGKTLLHVAAEKGSTEAIQMLLDRGALPNSRTHEGKTPADLARENGHLEARKCITGHILKHGMIGHDMKSRHKMLLDMITETANKCHTSNSDEHEAHVNAVKKASLFLASGKLLESPVSLPCHPLHLAITSNCTPLLTLLLATGAPLLSSSNGRGPVQTAWFSSSVSTRVGVLVTRATVHKIHSEMKLLDLELRQVAKSLVELLDGDEPWAAKVSIHGDSSSTLDDLLFRACASGATTCAWWLWYSGASTIAQNKAGVTPLHAALDEGHVKTAVALILHMGGNLYLPDINGRKPINLMPDDIKKMLSKALNEPRVCKQQASSAQQKVIDQQNTQAAKGKSGPKGNLKNTTTDTDNKPALQTTEGVDSGTGIKEVIPNVSSSEVKVEVPSQKNVTIPNESGDTEEIKSFHGFRNLKTKKNKFFVKSSNMLEMIYMTGKRNTVLDESGMGEIHRAAEKGDIAKIKLMLSQDKEVANALTKDGSTPLHFAAYRGNIEVIKILIMVGSKTESENKTGDTPLHLAALNGKESAVHMLISKNVVKLASASQDKLLHYARYNNDKPQLDALKSHDNLSPEGNTPLHFAAFAGHLGVVNLLLDNNFKPNQTTGIGHSPLHYATLRGWFDIVTALINAGADPNAKDGRLHTPVHFAAMNGHASVVDLLAKEKADLWIQADTGRTALHQAAFYGRLVTVQKVVEIQSDLIDITDNMELTAEDAAHIRGHRHVAWWLHKHTRRHTDMNNDETLDFCKDLNNSYNGQQFMTDERTIEKIECLATAIDFGFFDLHYQDEEGRTMLHVAAEENDRHTIQVLLDRGALPNARTYDGKTPSDIAKEKGYIIASSDIDEKIITTSKVNDLKKIFQG